MRAHQDIPTKVDSISVLEKCLRKLCGMPELTLASETNKPLLTTNLEEVLAAQVNSRYLGKNYTTRLCSQSDTYLTLVSEAIDTIESTEVLDSYVIHIITNVLSENEDSEDWVDEDALRIRIGLLKTMARIPEGINYLEQHYAHLLSQSGSYLALALEAIDAIDSVELSEAIECYLTHIITNVLSENETSQDWIGEETLRIRIRLRLLKTMARTPEGIHYLRKNYTCLLSQSDSYLTLVLEALDTIDSVELSEAIVNIGKAETLESYVIHIITNVLSKNKASEDWVDEETLRIRIDLLKTMASTPEGIHYLRKNYTCLFSQSDSYLTLVLEALDTIDSVELSKAIDTIGKAETLESYVIHIITNVLSKNKASEDWVDEETLRIRIDLLKTMASTPEGMHYLRKSYTCLLSESDSYLILALEASNAIESTELLKAVEFYLIHILSENEPAGDRTDGDTLRIRIRLLKTMARIPEGINYLEQHCAHLLLQSDNYLALVLEAIDTIESTEVLDSYVIHIITNVLSENEDSEDWVDEDALRIRIDLLKAMARIPEGINYLEQHYAHLLSQSGSYLALVLEALDTTNSVKLLEALELYLTHIITNVLSENKTSKDRIDEETLLIRIDLLKAMARTPEGINSLRKNYTRLLSQSDSYLKLVLEAIDTIDSVELLEAIDTIGNTEMLKLLVINIVINVLSENVASEAWRDEDTLRIRLLKAMARAPGGINYLEQNYTHLLLQSDSYLKLVLEALDTIESTEVLDSYVIHIITNVLSENEDSEDWIDGETLRIRIDLLKAMARAPGGINYLEQNYTHLLLQSDSYLKLVLEAIDAIDSVELSEAIECYFTHIIINVLSENETAKDWIDEDTLRIRLRLLKTMARTPEGIHYLRKNYTCLLSQSDSYLTLVLEALDTIDSVELREAIDTIRKAETLESYVIHIITNVLSANETSEDWVDEETLRIRIRLLKAMAGTPDGINSLRKNYTHLLSQSDSYLALALEASNAIGSVELSEAIECYLTHIITNVLSENETSKDWIDEDTLRIRLRLLKTMASTPEGIHYLRKNYTRLLSQSDSYLTLVLEALDTIDSVEPLEAIDTIENAEMLESYVIHIITNVLSKNKASEDWVDEDTLRIRIRLLKAMASTPEGIHYLRKSYTCLLSESDNYLILALEASNTIESTELLKAVEFYLIHILSENEPAGDRTDGDTLRIRIRIRLLKTMARIPEGINYLEQHCTHLLSQSDSYLALVLEAIDTIENTETLKPQVINIITNVLSEDEDSEDWVNEDTLRISIILLTSMTERINGLEIIFKKDREISRALLKLLVNLHTYDHLIPLLKKILIVNDQLTGPKDTQPFIATLSELVRAIVQQKTPQDINELLTQFYMDITNFGSIAIPCLAEPQQQYTLQTQLFNAINEHLRGYIQPSVLHPSETSPESETLPEYKDLPQPLTYGEHEDLPPLPTYAEAVLPSNRRGR